MNCPTCVDERLTMADRSGIEIDYCPKGRGVWLDRGELDKIIERSLPDSPPPRQAAPQRDSRDDRRDYDRSDRHERRDDDRHDDDSRGDRRPKRRRESLLGELFDF